MADIPDAIVVGGFLRFLGGLALFTVAAALILLGFRLGWGIGWMAWIPALFLLLPALALAGRREIRRRDGGIERSDGWLFRRILVLSLADSELEILPAGGAWTVVLHRGGRELPLAAWVGHATAEAIASLCDHAHPQGAVPRRQARRPENDR